jgi:phage repressor protein C with HTH and peptisase S24 domain
MNEVELNEFRIGRLSAAVNHVSDGNKTDFGRRLGYKDGAFVRQMLSGIRPVTEKTIWAIEAMPGMKDWFADPSDASPRAQQKQAPAWPFPTIAEDEVRALPAAQLSALEGAIALAIAQLKLGITVARPQPVAPSPPRARGSLVDINDADDPFPMRIDGMPAAPWDGGKTTHQAERDSRIRISTQAGVLANVGPGEPHAANDKFEKVPEMADVRLAAGDGIENHIEEQTGVVQFRRSFLRSVGADAGKARVVYAKGDSMEPVIKDGAALLVVPNEDLTLRDLASGGVYAINYDGKMIVKTVARDRLTKHWVARSFNPAYPDIPLENGTPVRVLGQVVWAGARLGDDESGQWIRT